MFLSAEWDIDSVMRKIRDNNRWKDLRTVQNERKNWTSAPHGDSIMV